MNYLDKSKQKKEETSDKVQQEEEQKQEQHSLQGGQSPTQKITRKTSSEENQKIYNLQSQWFKSPQITPQFMQKYQQIGELETESDNQDQKAFILGICGGSSAGKSLLSQLLRYKMREYCKNNNHSEFPIIPILKQSDFYHTLPTPPKGTDPLEFKQEYLKNKNHDEPSAIDWDYMVKCLQYLKSKTPVDVPVYNMDNQQREKKTKKFKTKADIIIVEGTLIFNNPKIREMCNLKIFLDSDEDIRLSRRVYKECVLREKPLDQVIAKYRKFTKEAFEKYTFPTKKYADIVIPNFGGDYHISALEEEQTAGFSTIDNGVVLLVLNLLSQKISKLNQNQIIEEENSASSHSNSPQQSPGIIPMKDEIQIPQDQQQQLI